jgi:leader peptidase (prepilin peptidase) / N-methyltransferase
MIVPDLVGTLGGAATAASAPDWLRLSCVAAALVICAAIAVVDARERIIPDWANAALGGAGLVLAGWGDLDGLWAAAAQGAVSFGLFWAFRSLYRRVRGVQGLGFGDVKFLGAAGIWIGLGGLAPLLLLACLSALAVVAIARLRGAAITGRFALPFGPFLAFGLAVLIVAAVAASQSLDG